MSEVTVLVPCYNHAPFIERCLRSIFAQTYRPKKVIVVNDGSTDKSPEVIKKVLEDCPFPSDFISQKNRGLCATLNEGFSRVETEYFSYIASDDIWLPKFLESRVAVFKKNLSAVLVFGYAYLIDNDENIFDCSKNWKELPSGNMLPTLLEGSAFPCHSVLFRTDILRKYNWNKDSFLEDYEMYLKLSNEGEFVRDNNILCAWRLHGANTSDDWLKMFSEILNTQKRCREILGLSEIELEEIQNKFKINTVDQFIRTGNPRKALSLLWENKSSAESYSQIAKSVFRLLIPQPIFQWNRNRKKQNAIKKYGKLEY